MNKLNITRLAVGASVTGALVVAAMSFASGAKSTQTAAAGYTDPATLPKFANVTVVNATPEQIATIQRSEGASGFAVGQRAYVDPATKQLRPALPEELAADAAAARNVAAAPAVVTTTAQGAKHAKLDESFMSYAVAHVEADGSVKQDCIEHQPSEQAALQAAIAAPGVDRNEK
jgi:hypothetical protein